MNSELTLQHGFDVYSIIGIIGIVQGFFFSVVLLTNIRHNHRANIYLGLCLLSISIGLIDIILIHTGYYLEYPWFLGVTNPVDTLYGPLFYFYVCALTSADFSWSKKKLLHLIPTALMTLLTVLIVLVPIEEKYKALTDFYEKRLATNTAFEIDWGDLIFDSLIYFQCLTYLILVFKRIARYEAEILENFSSTDRLSLRWLKLCLGVLLSLWTIWFLLGVFDQYDRYVIYLPVIASPFIYGMGYYGLKQPELFHFPSEKKKYESSSLTSDQSQNYLNRILELMENEKLYCDPELSLNTLAEKISIPDRYVSQIINEQRNQNFFDFINNYRINEAKKLLISDAHQHLTILAIAFDCGFNSKSAFNAAFKKYTGLTPSAYKKSLPQAS
ncbi:AraC family transcriptional regulator [bacterium]|nr:AraC family transcriptional regulator [bacterium]